MKHVVVHNTKSKLVIEIDQKYFNREESETYNNSVINYPLFLSSLSKDLNDEMVQESLEEKLDEFLNQVLFEEYDGCERYQK